MALILLGKSKCLLCGQIMQKDEELKAFPAFLPSTHKFGKFSDAGMHQICFDKDPDAQVVSDMLYVYEKIYNSKPQNLNTLEEQEAWIKEAFDGWPPPNGVVIYESLDSDGEWFWSDKDMWEEFEKVEAEAHKKMEEALERTRKEEWECLRYSRDDD